MPPGLTLKKILLSAHRVFLCVLCGSEKKQRSFSFTVIIDWFQELSHIQRKAAISFIISVRPSAHSISVASAGRISVKFGIEDVYDDRLRGFKIGRKYVSRR